MANHKCPNCGKETVKIMWGNPKKDVEAYRCRSCGAVWKIELLDKE